MNESVVRYKRDKIVNTILTDKRTDIEGDFTLKTL